MSTEIVITKSAVALLAAAGRPAREGRPLV